MRFLLHTCACRASRARTGAGLQSYYARWVAHHECLHPKPCGIMQVSSPPNTFNHPHRLRQPHLRPYSSRRHGVAQVMPTAATQPMRPRHSTANTATWRSGKMLGRTNSLRLVVNNSALSAMSCLYTKSYHAIPIGKALRVSVGHASHGKDADLTKPMLWFGSGRQPSLAG
jgi:hypothetical protein